MLFEALSKTPSALQRLRLSSTYCTPQRSCFFAYAKIFKCPISWTGVGMENIFGGANMLMLLLYPPPLFQTIDRIHHVYGAPAAKFLFKLIIFLLLILVY